MNMNAKNKAKITSYEVERRIQLTRDYISIDHNTYENTNIKCIFIDSKYGKWPARPDAILLGGGHPKRNADKQSKAYTKPSFEVEKEIQSKYPFISIVHEEYSKTKEPCTFVDLQFGPWTSTAHRILSGKLHPERYKFTIKQRSYEVERIIQITRPYITIDHSTYKNTNTRCRFIDSEYGEWWTKPQNVLKGTEHQDRNGSKELLTSYEVERRIQITRSYITVDHSTYKNTRTKCRFIDNVHGEWWTTPNSVLRGSDHYDRGIIKFSKSNTKTSYEFEQIIQKTQPYTSIDHSTYTNMDDVCTFVDVEYGSWPAKPKNVLKGVGHPLRHKQGYSVGEKRLADFISQYEPIRENLKFYYNENKNWHELDIFIPSLNIGIEYNGLYWHSSAIKKPEYHKEKREFFESKGIKLLQFYDNECRDKQDLVNFMILAKIGKVEVKYQARKLKIKTVPNKEAQVFLSNNHLMGEHKASKYIGLFNNNELISLLGYRKIKTGIDISRFCNKLNSSVAGGYSKLLNYVEKLEKPEFIQSFVDLRYGNGKTLEQLGFKLENITLGWMWTDYRNTYNRLYCRANMDDRKLTEAQHAEEMGLCRIYDAGQARYVKAIPKA